jgi:N utilization substance protein A
MKRKRASAVAVKKRAVRKTQKRKLKPSAKASAARKKPSSEKIGRTSRNLAGEISVFPRDGARARARSGGQSGSLQGLSDIEGASSESVDELLEEGNTFEAQAVRGVEQADNADEEEVHTHEVPEDDVPEEYIDKD